MGVWIRVVSWLVPRAERRDWREEWLAELSVSGTWTHARGALADAWYLRTEGWSMDGMWRDVRMAARALARKPVFTGLAALTLAIGIGANTAIYSVVDAVLVDPLPFPEPERLVSYNHEAPGLGVNVPVIPLSEAMYLHYAENATAIEALAIFTQEEVNLISEGEPQRLSALSVTRRYHDVVRQTLLLGRTFAEGEDRPGAEPVVILGFSLWQQSFGGDPSVLGTLVELDGVQRRIIGVLPEGAAVADEDLVMPLVIDDEAPSAGSLSFIGVARLAPGATLETANVEMNELLRRFASAYPDELGPELMEQAGLAADVKPLKEMFVQDLRQALWILLGTVGFVLLIACANVANLFLVRAEARQREQAVRTALGASRSDVTRQYVAEALTLAVFGGVLGLALAAAGVRGLLAIVPAELPQILEIGIDGTVLLFTAAISVGSGLLFGLFPVFGYGRRDLSNALKDGGRASTAGRERHRARSALVVAQVSLALVLLVGSGLMARSLLQMKDVDLGFEPSGVLTFALGLPEAEYPGVEESLDFHRKLMERLAAAPGVEAVGSISGIPLGGQKAAGPLMAADNPLPDGQLGPIVEQRRVTPGYFETMGIDLVEGRELEWTDRADGLRGVIISATLAHAFWPGQSALGRQIVDRDEGVPWEVVGVADEVRFDGVEEEPIPIAYFPVVWGSAEEPLGSTYLEVVMRTGGDPLGALPAAREALRAVDARLPMIRPRTLDTVVEGAMASMAFTVILLGVAAGIALLLGTVGIYGVISYIVSRRTQEIGVRIALGAPAAIVLRSVIGDGLKLAVLGVGLGLLGAYGLSQVLASLLYGVSATDPATFGGMAALLILVAALAAWVPARRASRVDPIEALRAE